MRTVTTADLERQARQVVDEVRSGGEAVVVESHGEPLAALLPYDEYLRYLRYRGEVDSLFDRVIATTERNAVATALTEDEAMALADAVRQQIWDERKRLTRD